MKSLFFLFLLLAPALLFSQQKTPPSQADLDKMQKELQQKAQAVMNDPKLKQYLNKSNSLNTTQPNNISQMGNPANALINKPDTAFLSKIKIPKRNSRALGVIPSKVLSHPQLVAFIFSLKKTLLPALQQHYSTEVLDVSSLNSTALSTASALAWCRERPDIALELSLDAAEKNVDDPNALNNLAGILTMCGMPFACVPILDYVRQTDPDNSTVNNNLGQAYVAMGDVQKGSSYLKKALVQSPDHPDANLSLARIAYVNGDRAGAQQYCEHSLRGGFYPDAWNMLKSLNKKAKLMDLIRHRYKQPDYFNPHKYRLPEQCRSTDQLKPLKMEYTMFRNMLHAEKDRYRKLLKVEEDYIKKNMAVQVMKTIHKQKSPFRPFGAFAIVVLGDIEEDYSERLLKLNYYDSGYFRNLAALNKSYEDQKQTTMFPFKDRADKAGEGNPDMALESDMCKALNELSNGFLPQFADLNEARQKEWINQTRDYFNDYAFWCYIASLDDHQYHQMYYQLVIEYLNLMEKLAVSRFIGCSKTFDTDEKDKAFEFQEQDCPYNTEIPFPVEDEKGKLEGFIGKIQLDCEALGVELGEGLIFNMDRKLGTGETTLAFGAGLSKNIPYCHFVEGGAKMQFYITFGGSQGLDIGIRYEAEMDIKGLNKPEQKAGMIIGINSGGSHLDTYGEGVIANTVADKVLDLMDANMKQDSQINPNIKMYNNGSSKKE